MLNKLKQFFASGKSIYISWTIKFKPKTVKWKMKDGKVERKNIAAPGVTVADLMKPVSSLCRHETSLEWKPVTHSLCKCGAYIPNFAIKRATCVTCALAAKDGRIKRKDDD